MYTAEIVKYTENAETGMAVADVEITDDSNPTEKLAIMTVHEKITDIHERIKTDLKQFTDQHKAQVEVEPPQQTYTVADNGTVS